MRHKAPGGLVDEKINRRRSTCKTEGEAGRGRVCHLPEPKVTFPSARSQKTVLAHRTHLCWQSLCSGIPVCHACWKPSCIHAELIQKKVTGAFLPRQAVTLRYLTVTEKAAECHQSVCKHSCPSPEQEQGHFSHSPTSSSSGFLAAVPSDKGRSGKARGPACLTLSQHARYPGIPVPVFGLSAHGEKPSPLHTPFPSVPHRAALPQGEQKAITDLMSRRCSLLCALAV